MSLLDCYAHECVLLTRKTVPDGEGGYLSEWSEGAAFTVYMAPGSSSDGEQAGKELLASSFEALVPKSTVLSYGDYFKTGGATYRVASCPSEKESPACASFSLMHFTFERKELADD